MSTDSFALQAWSNAERHLQEAQAIKEVAPGATVHLSYYAMFHAARAVLLREEGASPKKHGSVARQFGAFVKDRGETLRGAGSDLESVQAKRIRADYGDDARISSATAQGALTTAVAFLDLCSREFGFARSGPADE